MNKNLRIRQPVAAGVLACLLLFPWLAMAQVQDTTYQYQYDLDRLSSMTGSNTSQGYQY